MAAEIQRRASRVTMRASPGSCPRSSLPSGRIPLRVTLRARRRARRTNGSVARTSEQVTGGYPAAIPAGPGPADSLLLPPPQGPLVEPGVHERDREHGLGDRDHARADARVVAALDGHRLGAAPLLRHDLGLPDA